MWRCWVIYSLHATYRIPKVTFFVGVGVSKMLMLGDFFGFLLGLLLPLVGIYVAAVAASLRVMVSECLPIWTHLANVHTTVYLT